MSRVPDILGPVKPYLPLIALGVGAALVLGYFAKKGAVAVANAVNPVNHDNVFATAVNSVGQATSGDSSWSLGGAVWDFFHPSDASSATHDIVYNQKLQAVLKGMQ